MLSYFSHIFLQVSHLGTSGSKLGPLFVKKLKLFSHFPNELQRHITFKGIKEHGQQVVICIIQFHGAAKCISGTRILLPSDSP
jgi:hypothetical protein